MNTSRTFRFLWQSRSASILILACWALSFLAFLAVYAGVAARQKLTFMDRLNQRAELRLAAEGGVRSAWADAHLINACPCVRPHYEDVPIGGNILFSALDRYYDEDEQKLKDRFSLVDEESKINLNTASFDVLTRLFTLLNVCWGESEARALAAAIIDWRDSDEAPEPGGAESGFYGGLHYPYLCKNANFESMDELLLVRSVTYTIFEELKRYATVYGSGQVNINTASRRVLLALGIGEATVAKIIAFRSGKDGKEWTPDDKRFLDPFSIASRLMEDIPMTESEVVQLNDMAKAGLLTTTSENFSIVGEARYRNKKGHAAVSCAFQLQPLPEGAAGYKVNLKYWHLEYY